MGGAAAQAQANTSKGSALPVQAPCGEAQCPEGRIRLGVFFDGTNNNMFRDWGATTESRKGGNLTQPKDKDADVNGPSNVAKLHEMFIEQPPLQRKVYFIGIGGGDKDSQAGDGGNYAAQATGWGGRARVDGGMDELKIFVNTGSHQKAKEKRVDVFGFSRGAAEARDFVNKVNASGIDNTADWKGEYKTIYVNAGRGGAVPVRVKSYKRTEGILFEFLGIFDTVASMGIGAFASWGNSAAGYSLNVPGRPADKTKTPDEILAGEEVKPKEQWVHRTFHAIAEDEYREMFPIDVMGLDPKSSDYLCLPKYLRERPYPGCHSDIGGGYRYSKGKDAVPPKRVFAGRAGYVTVPGEPAVPEKFPNMCNIPLKDMHEEAKLGHVPLADIPNDSNHSIGEPLQGLYNTYLAERQAIFAKHLGNLPKYADYLHDMKQDPVYLQAITESVYQKIQEERLKAPGYAGLASGYLHNSNTGFLWGATGFLKRLVNWTRTFASQRGVNYRDKQNSYDPDSSTVR